MTREGAHKINRDNSFDIKLSAREKQVAAAVTRGESNKAIALALGISEYTVRDHVSTLLRKFGVASRVQLASFLIRQALHIED